MKAIQRMMAALFLVGGMSMMAGCGTETETTAPAPGTTTTPTDVAPGAPGAPGEDPAAS